MKKVLIIALMACLGLGVAFADGLKVGAQGGYGAFYNGFVSKDDSCSYLMAKVTGFYGAASLEFDASEALGLKAEFGALIPSKAFLIVRNGKNDTASKNEVPDGASDVPTMFTGYLGLQFNADLAETLSLGLGAGLDLTFGGEDDDFNMAIGAGAEVIISVNLSAGLSLNAGAKGGYYFFNTDPDLKEQAEAYNSNYASFSWKAFGGVTIAL